MNISSVQAGHINCSHRTPKTKSERQPLTRITQKIEWLEAKAHFTLKGSSLSKWCREQDTDLSTFRKAFIGKWEGPRARDLVRRLEEEMRKAA